MDSAHWPQPRVVVKSSMEEEEEGRRGVGERKAKGGKDQILNCPRCNSSNTKFCYYNNYSLSQPRYFCKSCRRYWTAGGSLRNIPVGGASRKNKRPSSSAPSSSSSPANNNKIIINSNDGDDQILQSNNNNPITINGNSQSNINTSCSSTANTTCWLSSDDHMNQMLRSNGMSPRELIPFMPMPASAAPQPTSMCTTAGESTGEARRLFFSTGTVEDFKQLPTIISTDHQNNGGKLSDVPAFWNGIFGGGSW